MITKRIIPCLDVRNGRVVKGTNFEGIRDVADPVEMARMYNAAGADELVFYDITASFEGRALFTDILTRVASEIFIPLTVGGGINTLEDFDRVLKCGADKVSVNSGALKNPDLIPAAAQRYGNQCVVLSADVKRVDGQFRVFAKGGREDTGRDALDWISWCVNHGAGEICLNSIDTDGVRSGFDLEMLDAVAARVNVPIIASGGAGKKEDFLELFHHKGIDAGLAAGIFHQKLPRLSSRPGRSLAISLAAVIPHHFPCKRIEFHNVAYRAIRSHKRFHNRICVHFGYLLKPWILRFFTGPVQQRNIK